MRQEWDAVRSERTSALDTILESLGAQLVPPGFHQTSTDSSLFGSQHSLDKVKGIIDPTQSPSATVRENVFEKKPATKHVDRSTWKTLRDFVDESAIEQVLDAVESDRTRLDVRVWSLVPLPAFFSSGRTCVVWCRAGMLMYAHTGRHVDDVRLPRNALDNGFFYTRLFTCLGRTASNRVFAGFPGEDDDWNGEASGKFGIAL